MVREAKFEESYNKKVGEVQNMGNDLTQCRTQRESMFSLSQMNAEVEREKRIAQRQQQTEDQYFIWIVVLLAFGYNWYTKTKQTVGGSGVGQPITGKWK